MSPLERETITVAPIKVPHNKTMENRSAAV
jgi:hypothetical protein